MRIGEWNIDGVKLDRMRKLPPVGRDHVGRRRQAGGAAEFGKNLSPRITVLGAARVFRIGEYAALAAAQFYGFIQRPGAVRIERYARRLEALRQCRHGLHFFAARQHAAFELEIGEAVFVMRRFRETHDCVRRQGFVVAKPEPAILVIRRATIPKLGAFAIADVKQIAEELHRFTLLAFAQQRGNGHIEMLPQQIEQRGLDGRDGVDHDAQIERLKATSAGIAIGKALADRVERCVERRDGLANDQRLCILQRLANALTARNLTGADMAGIVRQNNDVAREQRTVRAAQIEQHAVFTRHGYDAHIGDDRRARTL
jgi:hypothetical protein